MPANPDNVEDRIDSTNNNLEQERARLKSKFTAMETAIAEMNSQMSWLDGQINAGQK